MWFSPVRHNGKENPIGIETSLFVMYAPSPTSHNGKENPIGIETMSIQGLFFPEPGSQWKRKPDRD